MIIHIVLCQQLRVWHFDDNVTCGNNNTHNPYQMPCDIRGKWAKLCVVMAKVQSQDNLVSNYQNSHATLSAQSPAYSKPQMQDSYIP